MPYVVYSKETPTYLTLYLNQSDNTVGSPQQDPLLVRNFFIESGAHAHGTRFFWVNSITKKNAFDLI